MRAEDSVRSREPGRAPGGWPSDTARTLAVASPDDGDSVTPAFVIRRRLLHRITASGQPWVVLLSAPAGSGKSVLLSQWAALESRPTAWLTCLESHLYPADLVQDLASAVAAALGPGPVTDSVARMHAGDPLRNVTRLVRAMAAEPKPGLMVIDDLHALRAEPRSLDIIVTLVDQLPAGWSIAIAGREFLPLPVSRWLATGGSLVRLGLDDLALDADECGQLLGLTGLVTTERLVRDVLERTEGWAVAAYLTALILRSERPLLDSHLVAGDDVVIRSYLESEILAGLSKVDNDLLMRTSIVPEVSASLAEAITGIHDAGARLSELSRANLLVMPVDRQERWYRYHGLLQDLLRRRLEDQRVDRRVLHARAARWYEESDDIDNAIAQAALAHEDAQVRRLVLEATQDQYRRGSVVTVQRWLGSVTRGKLAVDPQLALVRTLVDALEGDTASTVRAAALARLDDPEEDLQSRHLDRACIRAFLGQNGPQLMREDALRSLGQHDPDWPWAPLAWLALGSAERMLGAREAALRAFEALERTADGGLALARLAARAERAQAAIEARAWSDAEAIIREDRHFVVDLLDPGRVVGTLWLVTDARLQMHRGDLRTAGERLRQAQLGRLRLTWAVPWYAVRTLCGMAQAQLLVGDVSGARASVAQAREIRNARPRIGALEAELQAVEARAVSGPTPPRGGSALSPAELRLLPLLQTYLSFKEIGERLSISPNTVKTEAMSIYGKLDASTRSEAVERAVAAGLLENPFA